MKVVDVILRRLDTRVYATNKVRRQSWNPIRRMTLKAYAEGVSDATEVLVQEAGWGPMREIRVIPPAEMTDRRKFIAEQLNKEIPR